MPLFATIPILESTTLYVWKITEDFDTLFKEVVLKDTSLFRLENMKSESHQKGFLAVRMLLQYLGFSDYNLYYDETGKPNLMMEDGSLKQEAGGRMQEAGGRMQKTDCRDQKTDSSIQNLERKVQKESPNTHNLQPNTKNLTPKTYHISISHSFDFSALVISDKNVGLDVEQVKEKNLKIVPRFMNIKHLEGLNEKEAMQKATVIWGIKETVFKLKNEKGISFPNHIFEEDFNLEDKKAQAKLCFNEHEENFHFVFDFLENYAFVCGFEKQ